MGEFMSSLGSGAVFLIAGLIIVLLVGGTLLKRKAVAAGERAGQKFSEKVGAAQQARLGTTVVLVQEPGVVAELVEEATARMKLVTRTAPASWDIEAIEKGDLTFSVSPAQGGTRLSVDRYRDHFGQAAGAPYWKDVVKKVEALAQERGVAISTGEVQHVRSRQIDDKNWEWAQATA